MFTEGSVADVTFDVIVGVIVAIFSYVLVAWLISSKPQNLPPLVTGLPVVGYLLFLTKEPHLKLNALRKKYGNVVSFYLGNKYCISLGDVVSVKEAFSKPEFLGRPPVESIALHETMKHSIVTLSGRPWQEQRRFAIHSMKDLGFGKSRMEERMKDEIVYCMERIAVSKGEPIVIKDHLIPSISNNISAFIFGKRFDYNDEKRKFLDYYLEETVKFISLTGIHSFMPWLAKIPFLTRIWNFSHFQAVVMRMLDFMNLEIKEHQDTLDPNNIRDFIDGYLVEMESQKEQNTSFTDTMLKANIQALFGAGSETVRTTIDWAVYIMAGYPDVQRKVQEEIDDVIGRERTPKWFDQADMPYTQSVLMEVQRWRTILPLNLFRYTTADTTVCGYHIPKGSAVLANLWAVHNDPDYWDNPETFIPDRFVTEDGKSVTKNANYMPFSTGKRSCPGQIMAVVEMFLYITTILQRFEIRLPEGVNADFEGVVAFTNQPKPHKLCFVERSTN